MYKAYRVIYTLLSFLKDIGGLFSAFNGMFGGLMFILTFNGLYQLLTSRLYRVNVLPENANDGKSYLQRVLERERNSRVANEVDKHLGIS